MSLSVSLASDVLSSPHLGYIGRAYRTVLSGTAVLRKTPHLLVPTPLCCLAELEPSGLGLFGACLRSFILSSCLIDQTDQTGLA